MALTPGDTRNVLTEVWLRDHKLEQSFRVCVPTCKPYLSTVVRLMVCRYHCIWLPNRKQPHVTKKIEGSSITDSWGGVPEIQGVICTEAHERNTFRIILAINQKLLFRFFWIFRVLTILYLNDCVKVLVGIGTLVSANLFQ